MTDANQAWVSQPSPTIIDPHQHFYASQYRDYGRYLIADFRRDAVGLRLAKSVYIECSQMYRPDGPEHLKPVGETEWVAGLSDDGIASAIVGYADLASPALSETIAAHVDAGAGKFRGVRIGASWEPGSAAHSNRTPKSAGMLTSLPFKRGLAVLADSGLTFEVAVHFHQLAEVLDMARSAPDNLLVLNHLGGFRGTGQYAQAREHVTASLRSGLLALAACPNVVVKLGGLGGPHVGFSCVSTSPRTEPEQIVQRWSDDVRWAISQFGPERCMFASNFPVDRKAFTYASFWTAADLMTQDFSEAERASLFHTTAARTYRLED